MNAAIVALVAAFAGPPVNASIPPGSDIEVAETADSQAPPEPAVLEVASDEVLQPDGRRVRWASVTYELSNGHEAEVFVEVDERGHGDGLIYVEGEALLHVTTNDHGTATTWVAPDIDMPPQLIAELGAVNVANEIFAGIGNEPLAFPCSEFGKKVVRFAKYLWVGMVGAAGGACCVASGGAACIVCGAATGVAQLAGTEAADGYCE